MPKLVPSATREEIVQRFCSHGWGRHHGYGVAANVFRESSFCHTLVGDGGKAFGLGQWHHDRQAIFRKQYGKPIQKSTWQEQVDFIDYELRNNERAAGAKLMACRTAREAGMVLSRFYERPRDANREAHRRGDLAQRMFDDNQGHVTPAEGSHHGV